MDTFSSIGRSVAAAGVVGGLMVVLAACGSEAEMVSANQVEEDINQLVKRENGRADSVECPDLPADVGGSIRCSVMTADKKEHGVTVTVTSVEGSKTNYVIKVD